MNTKNKANLYIDESGKSSLIETKDPFIITGTIIQDTEIQAIEGFFTYIKRKYKIPENEPFHSYHTFEFNDTKLSDRILQELAKSLAEFVSLIPIKVRILSTDKKVFRTALGVRNNNDLKGHKKLREMRNYPYRVMAADLFSWFANELNGLEMIGQVTADSRRGGDHQLLKTLNLCKQGQVPYKNSMITKHIREKVTAICFSEKNYLSGGLELTDLISYVTYFKVRRLISANRNIGIDVLWEAIRNLEHIELVELDKSAVKRFFGIKKDEVHKYLK